MITKAEILRAKARFFVTEETEVGCYRINVGSTSAIETPLIMLL